MAHTIRQNDYENVIELDRTGVKIEYKTKSPRFSCQDPDALDDGLRYLDQYGYTIISDVLDVTEIHTAKNLIWQHLEGLKSPYKIKRGQINTWNQWPGRHEDGTIEDFGVGNSQAQWFIRSIPAIKNVFSEIWHTRDLLCSMDGIGLFRPWHLNPHIQEEDAENGINPWKTDDANWQVNKNPVTNSVRGIVNLLLADETTGGLMVIPGSHRRFHELFPIWTRTDDSSNISIDHAMLQDECGLLIHAEPGDLLLWNSRTVHRDTPAFVTSWTSNNGETPELLRMISYICMTPLVFAENPDELISQRLNAFHHRLTTSHWPYEFKIMGGEVSTGENRLQLTDYQRNLILGIDE